MMTSSAKRTLTGLVFNLAFLAALMNADFGDFWRERIERKKQRIKGQSLSLEMSHVGFLFSFSSPQFKDMFSSGKHDNFLLHSVLMQLRGLYDRAR